MARKPDVEQEVEYVELEEAESFADMYPLAIKLVPGEMVILDAAELGERAGAVALHLTVDEALYYLREEDLCWHKFGLSGKKPALKST